MMPCRTYYWYTFLSRGLLGYLLGLYLLGFSWHLNSHEHTGIAYHQATDAADHSDAVVSPDTACFLCDWLVHHSYINTGAFLAEIVSETASAPYHLLSANNFVNWLHRHQPSRAPPALG